MELLNYITKVPDFPKKGILFYDISTLLIDPQAWNYALDKMEQIIKEKNPDILAAIDARGFLIAAPLASRLSLPFTLIRKQGKLPGDVITLSYELEYGTDHLEIQQQAINKNSKVLICDDLLATGGTAQAAEQLIHKAGGNPIGTLFIIELSELNGKNKLSSPYNSIIKI